MARTEITAVALPAIGSEGYEITTSTDFVTMSTGSGNGVKFDFSHKTILVMKNDTGSAATFTLVMPSLSEYEDLGGTVNDSTIAVANGKTYLSHLSDIFKQTDGKAYVDCNVAGKIFVLKTTT